MTTFFSFILNKSTNILFTQFELNQKVFLYLIARGWELLKESLLEEVFGEESHYCIRILLHTLSSLHNRADIVDEDGLHQTTQEISAIY